MNTISMKKERSPKNFKMIRKFQTETGFEYTGYINYQDSIIVNGHYGDFMAIFQRGSILDLTENFEIRQKLKN